MPIYAGFLPWLAGGVLLAGTNDVSIDIRAPESYVPGVPFLVRVDLRDGGGRVDRSLGDTVAAISVEPPSVSLSTNLAWMAGAADLYGQTRIAGGRVDIGVSELQTGALACYVTASPAEGFIGSNVVLTGVAIGTNVAGVSYQWDLDGDGRSDREGVGLAVITNVYTNVGVYGVSLSVSNAAGETAARRLSRDLRIGPAVAFVSRLGAHRTPYTNWTDAGAGNYRLQTNSPCVDTGVNMPWTVGSLDLDGRCRTANGIVDMGAYELAPEDSDADGIADSWELRHAGSLTNMTATSDADGDGFADVEEYLAGTEPTNGQSLLRLLEAAQTQESAWRNNEEGDFACGIGKRRSGRQAFAGKSGRGIRAAI